MRALFCTDGSKISFNALKNFSHYTKATVDTICVIDWSFLPDETVIEAAGFVNNCRNIADSILDYSAKIIEECGMTAGEKIKLCGAVVESILEQLSNNSYDIVIMGSHGKKGLQRWLGSVSREILEAADIPVYISKNLNKAKNILFTADDTEIFEKTFNKACELIQYDNKDIYICAVTETPDLLFLDGTIDSNWMMAIQTQQQIYSEKSLNAAKTLITNKNLPVKESKVLSGIPAQSILDYAFEKEIDLIIMGARSKTKMERFLLDSVSKRVTVNTKSDVLIIPSLQ